MDTQRYDTMLAQQLGDPTSAIYSADVRLVALSEAVRAYSRYRPSLRRFGTASLYRAVSSPTTTIYISGIAFVPGTVITIDPGQPWAEAVTVASVTSDAPEDTLAGTALTITLSAPTTKTHRAGAMITQPTPGLQIVAGTDLYAMPTDFIRPEQASWDIATGSRRWVKRTESFAEGVQQQSEAIGGVGAGLSQTFRAGGIGGAFIGIQAQGGLVLPPAASPCQTQYIFDEGDPASLLISPVPTRSALLDFRYEAARLPAQVPDADMDALLDYGVYSALMQRATLRGGALTWRQADVAEDPHYGAKSLNDLAQAALARFDVAIRRRAFAVSG